MTAPVTTLGSGKFLALRRIGRWEYVDRINCRGAVALVAITPNHELILVEQYRAALNGRVLELPAGLVGDADNPAEAPETAARRELREETGYEAATFTPLLSGPTSAGLTSERVDFFLASGLHKISNGGGDAHEQITVHTVPLADIDSWLTTHRKAGMAIDVKVYAGLHFAKMAVPSRSPCLPRA
ncbi:MAG: NUDIX hydrolase [Deltaproteobacteria bacterium]|nr:NUDIX hydrolase [Deltaproteobacteria bacterium]